MDDGLLKSFGDEAIGVISCAGYTADLATPSNQRFVADSIRDYGGIPGSYAAGIYTKARVLQSTIASGEPRKKAGTSSQRVRGGCDLCGTEAPVVQCKVHQLHLCGSCLAFGISDCSGAADRNCLTTVAEEDTFVAK